MTVIFLIALVAVAITVALARSARLDAAPARVVATSPRAHAEQILAARYARGALSAQDYQRSLAILRQ